MKHITVMLTASLLFLAACGENNTPTEVVVRSTPIERVELDLPSTSRIQTRPVEWIVVTPENVEEVFAQFADQGDNLVLFALTSSGYENISLNYSDALTLIREQRAVISAYERYYIRVNN
jgi:hypothetical protein